MNNINFPAPGLGRARALTIAAVKSKAGLWNGAIVAVALVLIAAVWALAFERVEYEQANAVDDVVRNNSNFALALEEQTLRTIKSVDQVLGFIEREYLDEDVNASMQKLLAQIELDDHIFHNLGVIDQRGRVVLSREKTSGSVDLSDRDYFQAHRDGDSAGLFIAKPLVGRITGEPSIPMSRRITGPDGSFRGVVFASVDIDYFTNFYRRADLGRDGVIMLVGLDGIARARRMGEKNYYGQDMRSSTLFDQLRKALEGSYVSAGKLEGVTRFVSYRTLRQYPVVVAVGTSRDSVLAGISVSRRNYYAGASIVSLLIILCAGIFMRALIGQRRTIRLIESSEARFRAMFSQAAAGIVLSSLDARIIDINQVLCDGTGFSRDELVGKPVTLIVGSESVLAMRDERDQLLKGGARSITSEQHYMRKDGSRGWANRSISLIHGAEGEADYFISVFQDITESKKARQDLEIKHAILAAQQETSPDGILVVDDHSRIVSWNRRFLELWRIPEELARLGDDVPVLERVVSQTKDPDAFLARVKYLYEHPAERSWDEIRTLDGRTIERISAPAIGRSAQYFGRVWYFRDITMLLQSMTELRESEERFRRMAQTIGEVFWMAPPDLSAINYVSPAFETIWGRPCADLYARPLLWLEAVHPEDQETVRLSAEKLASGGSYDVQYRIRRPDGSERWINDRGYAMRDAAGKVVLTSGLASDITDRRKSEEQLRLSANAFDSIADGIIVTDPEQRIVSVNKAFTRITGYSQDELIGKTPKTLQSGRHDPNFYSTLWRELGENGHWKGEIWDRRKGGEIYPELLSISAIKDESGGVTHYVGVCTDISSLKRYEEELHHQAHHDALTGLPNRVLFRERFEETLNRAQRHGHQAAVLFLDLDHFKNINDSLGHAVGDLLLQVVSRRLTSSVREVDTVSRFGGDEFAVLLDTIDDSQGAAVVAQKLLGALALPFQIEGHEFFISVSIGIACFPQDGADIDVLFKNADTAMYRAKAEGRNNTQFFSAEMNAKALENLQMSNQLRLALERNELLLHYQPCIDLKTGRISSAEALVRWNHPELGMVPPARFIPLAEETGLIEPIGEWVIRTACRQMRAWQDEGLSLNRIAVNLSARQFRHPDLAQRIAAILKETGLAAHRLELEVTESMVMQNPESAAELLTRLKLMGMSIAIDDFGTGYSSLSYLKRFPIDFLKIDRSFVNGVSTDANDAAITSGIIALAKSLNLKLIAEGVETEEQRMFLESHGCDEGQGYLFSKPVPPEEIARQLAGARQAQESSEKAA